MIMGQDIKVDIDIDIDIGLELAGMLESLSRVKMATQNAKC